MNIVRGIEFVVAGVGLIVVAAIFILGLSRLEKKWPWAPQAALFFLIVSVSFVVGAFL
jgi:hypothetical protein